MTVGLSRDVGVSGVQAESDDGAWSEQLTGDGLAGRACARGVEGESELCPTSDSRHFVDLDQRHA